MTMSIGFAVPLSGFKRRIDSSYKSPRKLLGDSNSLVIVSDGDDLPKSIKDKILKKGRADNNVHVKQLWFSVPTFFDYSSRRSIQKRQKAGASPDAVAFKVTINPEHRLVHIDAPNSLSPVGRPISHDEVRELENLFTNRFNEPEHAAHLIQNNSGLIGERFQKGYAIQPDERKSIRDILAEMWDTSH